MLSIAMAQLMLSFAFSFAEEAKEPVIPPGQILIAPGLPNALFVDGRNAVQEAMERLPNFDRSYSRVKNFIAPKGTTNLAKGLIASSSCPAPNKGTFAQITDEDADSMDDCLVVLSPGPVWIQFDLMSVCELEKLWVWHCHKNVYVPMDVVIQLSDDPFFEKGVVTIFNNDHDNTLKFGAGKDPTYLNTNTGRTFDARGHKARHVRLWSNGNFTLDDDNRYTEVMIFGRHPADAK